MIKRVRARCARAWAQSLPACAICFLAGNLAIHQLPLLPNGGLILVSGAFAIMICLAFGVRSFACLLVGLVWTLVAARGGLEHRLDAARDGQDFHVIGWVDDFVNRNAASTTFSLHVDAAELVADGESVNLSRLRLTWYEDRPQIEPAMRLELIARLKQPRGLRNPGGFDYERWLYLSGYSATGYVRSGKVSSASSGELAPRWLRVRAAIESRIYAAAESPDAAALLSALVIGNRTGFSEEMWSSFRRTGTSHLVAISGLHIGLVATLVFVLVGAAVRRAGHVISAYDIEIAATMSAIAALSYAALAGFALPTQRALTMCLLALIVLARRCYTSAPTGFSTALIAVILIDPLATLTASLWMSFAAVAVLLVVVSAHRRMASSVPVAYRQWLRRLRDLLVIQTLLTMALAPFVLGFFTEFSAIALAVNLIAIPVFSFFLVPATLVAVLVTVLLPGLSVGISLMALAAGWALDLLRWCAEIPWATFGPISAGVSSVALAALGVGLALPWHEFPGRRLGWLAIAPLLFPFADVPDEGELNLIVLDVGHGLAVIAETKAHRLLYDAGAYSRSGFDTGERVVLPVLRKRPHPGLDRLIVSHADIDHLGGAPAVLAAYPNAHVTRGPDVEGLSGEVCADGQSWIWDSVKFEILHPSPGFEGTGNDGSCVLKIVAGHQSALLTGDIELRAERTLYTRHDLRAEVVVVPHHGSATSSSEEFVDRVAPEVAVVSAGYRNRWGFPRAEVRRRWAGAGAQLLVTGDAGAIEVTFSSGGLTVSRERDTKPRYWQAQALRSPG